MKMTDVQDFIEKQLDEPIQVLPFSFSDFADDDCIRFDIGQGGNDRGDVGEVVITLDTRALDPEKSERIALNMNDKLHDLTDKALGKYQVIAVKRRRVYPRYLGADEKKRHYYSADYLLLLT